MPHRTSRAEPPPSGDPVTRVQVWDLPTRLFHWTVVVLVAGSFATAWQGGNWMIWHMRCGYALLALLLFRLAWGFLGGRHARFSAFVRGFRETTSYARDLLTGNAPRHLGHNPLGGWSVVAMLTLLAVQATTGLFANDDIFIEGPLFGWVGKAASDRLTRLHRLNADGIAGLVALHVGAVLFHLFAKKENLIGPMLTGVKHWHGEAPSEKSRPRLALAILLCAAAAVALLVR